MSPWPHRCTATCGHSAPRAAMRHARHTWRMEPADSGSSACMHGSRWTRSTSRNSWRSHAESIDRATQARPETRQHAAASTAARCVPCSDGRPDLRTQLKGARSADARGPPPPETALKLIRCVTQDPIRRVGRTHRCADRVSIGPCARLSRSFLCGATPLRVSTAEPQSENSPSCSSTRFRSALRSLSCPRIAAGCAGAGHRAVNASA
eukprot:365603-Chlamydomonas_euryale.AAC.16